MENNVIYLASLNDFDGKSIIGVYSTEANALKGSVIYLEDEGETYLPTTEKRNNHFVRYKITDSSTVLVIRRMEVDDFSINTSM